MPPLTRFEFSQSSLQDYVDCPRRFHLRNIQRRAWPALQAEPARENERHMQRGQRFHRLVQQYLVGVPVERLTGMAEADPDENLRCWWQNFLASIPPCLNGERHIEVALSAPFAAFRLVAVYDLILVAPNGRITIYDWKTAVKRPKSSNLRQRMQTRVYPYLLTQAGAALNHDCPVLPEQVEMVYWFAEPGQSPETIPYSAAACTTDHDTIRELVKQIGLFHQSWPDDLDNFPLCDDESNCMYCVYRSLCNRGTSAAQLDGKAGDFELSNSIELDLEQIAEIQF